jgi:hypothetical protein
MREAARGSSWSKTPQVQQPVDQQMGVVRADGLALRARLARDHRSADHHVARKGARLVDEGKDVGGVVPAAELAIEAPALGFSHEAHRHCGGATECRAGPGSEHSVGGNVGRARGALDDQARAAPHAFFFPASRRS